MIHTLEHKILGYHVNVNKDQLNKINDSSNIQRQENVSKVYLVYQGIAKTLRAFFAKIKKRISSSSFFKERRVYSYYNSKENKETATWSSKIGALSGQIRNDQALISKSHAALIRKKTKEALNDWIGSSYDREIATEIGISTYATTYKYFAPVIYDWVINLLKRAKKDNLQLVFMARDGLCPFLAAKKIQRKVPALSTTPIHYVYLSRKIVNGDQQNLQEYLKQELSQGASSKFLFIDIGFSGSMVDKINSAMRNAIPDSQCQFQFLISTGKKVPGFVASAPNSMRALKCAGKNRAAYWIEDTHQGNIPSPSKLVKDAEGKLQPDTLVDIKPTKENPATQVWRDAALSAIDNFVDKRNVRADLAKRHITEKLAPHLRKNIEKWLEKVRQERILYIEHIS